jgi:hypothetical protein
MLDVRIMNSVYTFETKNHDFPRGTLKSKKDSRDEEERVRFIELRELGIFPTEFLHIVRILEDNRVR